MAVILLQQITTGIKVIFTHLEEEYPVMKDENQSFAMIGSVQKWAGK